MKDIKDRADIELLVNEFYKLVIKDDQIGFFFTEIISLDFDKHLPVMYDFWETTLLGNRKYHGNPMVKHILLNEKATMTSKHFERWLDLWEQTLSSNFRGPTTSEALYRAKQIAEIMKLKIGITPGKQGNQAE
ncbi:MAG: group III truncated hemoglobin [Bacteroidota bacterium]